MTGGRVAAVKPHQYLDVKLVMILSQGQVCGAQLQAAVETSQRLGDLQRRLNVTSRLVQTPLLHSHSRQSVAHQGFALAVAGGLVAAQRLFKVVAGLVQLTQSQMRPSQPGEREGLDIQTAERAGEFERAL